LSIKIKTTSELIFQIWRIDHKPNLYCHRGFEKPGSKTGKITWTIAVTNKGENTDAKMIVL